MLKLQDKNDLVRIFKTISWLDSRRWNIDENYNFIHFFRNDLTNCEKILTHWICYITDRQMPFELVWDKGGYVFSELVYEFSREKLSPQQTLDKHYEKYDNEGKERFRFKSQDSIFFASRFVTDDYQNILQTLEILNLQEYQRNIMIYIVDIIRRFRNEKDVLLRVACGLYLLTYQLNGKKVQSDEIIKILKDDKEFNKRLELFKRTSTEGKKRLWCCVRDYKKGLYHQIFNEAIKDVAKSDSGDLINIWDKLPMDQIELPGDVWNNSPFFRNNLFAKVLDIESIPRTLKMPKIIRELYIELKKIGEIDSYYPEQFDITFDFVPRMCDKKLCSVCLFYKNGVESICIPTENKCCPVVLISCGYISKCTGNKVNCIIKDGISKGICKGRLS